MLTKNNILSFWDLLDNSDFEGIKIPKIQRDYAQGRTDKDIKNKRIKFLEYLLNGLRQEKITILDFIYGSKDAENYFLPLDGQQRLTTLFLLHVYAYKFLEKSDSEIKEIQKKLIKFTYDTRPTSAKFIKGLVENDWDIPQINSEKLKCSSISSIIKNQIWYFSEYDYDQTIKAIFVMLEDIHKLFYAEREGLFKKLADKIRFYFLFLEQFNLSDDLYIKMNARGKMLTNFENTKAEIIELIKSEENISRENAQDEMQPFIKDRYKDGVSQFAKNTDVDWTNFLYKYKNKYNLGESYLVDYAYMRIFASCIIYNSDDESIIKYLNNDEQRNDLIDYFMYDSFKNGEIDKKEINKERCQNIFDEISKILNLYKELDEKIDFDYFPNDIIFWHFKNEHKLFRDLIFGSIDEKNQIIKNAQIFERVLFYAQTCYLLKVQNNLDDYGFNSVQYKNWMRVIRNIAETPDFPSRRNLSVDFLPWLRDIKQIKTAIYLIKSLSLGLSHENKYDVYNYLSKQEIDNEMIRNISGYYMQNRMKEEVSKAKIIVKNDYRKQKIFNLEDNELSRGSIRFALDCLEFNLVENNWDLDKFESWNEVDSLQNVLNKYFNDDNNKLPNGFRRAILAICDENGNYESYRYNFSSNNNMRVYYLYVNLTDLIGIAHLGGKLNKFAYIYLKNLVKQLVCGKDFEDIANNNSEKINQNWQKKLIENSEWENGKFIPFIFEDKDKKCYLRKKDTNEDIEIESI